MSRRPLLKLAAWLCLVATLLTGITPGQGWVLCLEPDGRIAFELAAEASGCGGCPDELAGARDATVPADEGPEECACIDIPLACPGDRDRVALRRIDLPSALPACLPAPFLRALQPPFPEHHARVEVPRPAPSLALIQSVVLRV